MTKSSIISVRIMKRNRKGFTLLEVVLVFGIAGLIFLMTFIALPALQRRARDSQREKDMVTFIEAVKKYQTNNRGALPSGSWETVLNNISDPSGEKYNVEVTACGGNQVGKPCGSAAQNKVAWLNSVTFEGNNKTFRVFTQAKCAGNEANGVVATKNSRQMAVLYRMEGGGVHCENN